MKEVIEDWLNQQSPGSGIFACGVRFADRTNLLRSFSASYPLDALENAWRGIADALQVLKLNRLPTERLRWTFEQAYLHCAVRPDGTWLGIFSSKDKNGPPRAQRICEEFRALTAR